MPKKKEQLGPQLTEKEYFTIEMHYANINMYNTEVVVAEKDIEIIKKKQDLLKKEADLLNCEAADRLRDISALKEKITRLRASLQNVFKATADARNLNATTLAYNSETQEVFDGGEGK